MIKLSRNYFIDTDRWNFILKRTVDVKDENAKNETYVVVVGYYISLKQALEAYRSELIRDEVDYVELDLEALNVVLKRLEKEIGEVVNEYSSINGKINS